MSLKASEISQLIKERIENFETTAVARDVGTVIGVTDGIFEAPSDWVVFVNYKFTDGYSFVEVVSTVTEYTSDDYNKHAPKSSFDWSPSTTYAAFRDKEKNNS